MEYQNLELDESFYMNTPLTRFWSGGLGAGPKTLRNQPNLSYVGKSDTKIFSSFYIALQVFSYNTSVWYDFKFKILWTVNRVIIFDLGLNQFPYKDFRVLAGRTAGTLYNTSVQYYSKFSILCTVNRASKLHSDYYIFRYKDFRSLAGRASASVTIPSELVLLQDQGKTIFPNQIMKWHQTNLTVFETCPH